MIKNKLSNQEIVTVAIYALGSGVGTFDIETIAIKADELAPGRFRWKTRPDLISDSNTWDALSNARKKGYILQQAKVFKGGKKEKDTDSYLLTEEGIKFSEKNRNIVKDFDQSKMRISVSKELYENTKNRLIATEAYQKAKNSKENEITIKEFNNFFRINDYMKNIQKEQKIQKILNLFIHEKEFKEVIKKIIKSLTKGAQNAQ
ncbi:hypothetical protein N9X11_01080 [Candidatus Pelagibacter bacterium]|nr:hypothetical protein [Candidatus Pelagibacter bacterium]